MLIKISRNISLEYEDLPEEFIKQFFDDLDVMGWISKGGIYVFDLSCEGIEDIAKQIDILDIIKTNIQEIDDYPEPMHMLKVMEQTFVDALKLITKELEVRRHGTDSHHTESNGQRTSEGRPPQS